MSKVEAKPSVQSRLKECPSCKGEGFKWIPKKTMCKVCNGKGFVKNEEHHDER